MAARTIRPLAPLGCALYVAATAMLYTVAVVELVHNEFVVQSLWQRGMSRCLHESATPNQPTHLSQSLIEALNRGEASHLFGDCTDCVAMGSTARLAAPAIAVKAKSASEASVKRNKAE